LNFRSVCLTSKNKKTSFQTELNSLKMQDYIVLHCRRINPIKTTTKLWNVFEVARRWFVPVLTRNICRPAKHSMKNGKIYLFGGGVCRIRLTVRNIWEMVVCLFGIAYKEGRSMNVI